MSTSFSPLEEPVLADAADVCSLPPDELAARLAWIREAILPRARHTERLADGLALELEAAPGLVPSLDRLIELERACCSGIVFERSEGRRPGGVRLEIRGVDPDSSLFRGVAVPEARVRRARWLRAAGIGSLASLFVCCVLPIAAAALFGAAAAPLAALDGPVPIALGALLGGASAWWWLGRRRMAATASVCRDPDC